MSIEKVRPTKLRECQDPPEAKIQIGWLAED